MQQNFDESSSKGLTYMHDLHWIYFYTICILKTCYMWCANEIYDFPVLIIIRIKWLEVGDVNSILLHLVTSIAI